MGVAGRPIPACELADLGGWVVPYWFSAGAAVAPAIAGPLLLAESVAINPRRIHVASTPVFSPDSRYVAYAAKRANQWFVTASSSGYG